MPINVEARGGRFTVAALDVDFGPEGPLTSYIELPNNGQYVVAGAYAYETVKTAITQAATFVLSEVNDADTLVQALTTSATLGTGAWCALSAAHKPILGENRIKLTTVRAVGTASRGNVIIYGLVL